MQQSIYRGLVVLIHKVYEFVLVRYLRAESARKLDIICSGMLLCDGYSYHKSSNILSTASPVRTTLSAASTDVPAAMAAVQAIAAVDDVTIRKNPIRLAEPPSRSCVSRRASFVDDDDASKHVDGVLDCMVIIFPPAAALRRPTDCHWVE